MRNAVYINAGCGHPSGNCATRSESRRHRLDRSPKLGDLDCDGRLDVFIANGVSGDYFNSDLLAAVCRFPEQRPRKSNSPRSATPTWPTATWAI